MRKFQKLVCVFFVGVSIAFASAYNQASRHIGPFSIWQMRIPCLFCKIGGNFLSVLLAFLILSIVGLVYQYCVARRKILKLSAQNQFVDITIKRFLTCFENIDEELNSERMRFLPLEKYVLARKMINKSIAEFRKNILVITNEKLTGEDFASAIEKLQEDKTTTH